IEAGLDPFWWIITVGICASADSRGLPARFAEMVSGSVSIFAAGAGWASIVLAGLASIFAGAAGSASIDLAGFVPAAIAGGAGLTLAGLPMCTFAIAPARARSLAAVIRTSNLPGVRLRRNARTVARPLASVTARSVGSPLANRPPGPSSGDRKSTRLNSSHDQISYG